jgi:SAM-dependent methyltransferase
MEPSFMGSSALEIFKSIGAKRILELGCGQGRDTFLFLREGFDVVALDYSPTCLLQLTEMAEEINLKDLLTIREQDIRKGISLPDESVDGCFSHMFFTMHLEEKELREIFREVLRVLRPGGLNIYSVRSVHDPHFQKGEHVGEDMWEMNGFVVHYFSEEKIRRLAEGYEILDIEEFDEGSLPKRLFKVMLRKP